MKPAALVCALLAAFLPAHAEDGPIVSFTKSFPGSVPAYVWIAVDQSGKVLYKEAADDDPDQFQLETGATAAIFDLAGKLNHFSQPLESGLKVANTGMKTFRWQGGEVSHEAKFNYSLDENAKALQDIFEHISESQQLLAELQRAVRHDRLGVQDALIGIEAAWGRKRLTGLQQFLPLLDQVAGNEIYLHMARERAAQLAEAIRALKSKTE